MRIAEVTERVETYLWEVSGLIIDESMLLSIGNHLSVKQSVIENCIADHPESVQLAAFNVLKEWKQPIKTNDLDALRSRLRHVFEEHNLVDQFLNIDLS